MTKMNSTHANHDADEEEYPQVLNARSLDSAEVELPPPVMPDSLDGWPLIANCTNCTQSRIMLVLHNFHFQCFQLS